MIVATGSNGGSAVHAWTDTRFQEHVSDCKCPGGGPSLWS